jgi:hypothetical protein
MNHEGVPWHTTDVVVPVLMQWQHLKAGCPATVKAFQACWQHFLIVDATRGTRCDYMDCVEKNIAVSGNDSR